MSILHTVNKSPTSNNTLLSCLGVCTRGDAILLIEDGTYAAARHLPTTELLVEKIASGTAVYALLEDVKTRGLEQQLAQGIKLVDYSGFVNLTITHQSVQSWY